MRISPLANKLDNVNDISEAANSKASRTPLTGSSGTVAALYMYNSPKSSSTIRSVNVPPVSHAKRIIFVPF